MWRPTAPSIDKIGSHRRRGFSSPHTGKDMEWSPSLSQESLIISVWCSGRSRGGIKYKSQLSQSIQFRKARCLLGPSPTTAFNGQAYSCFSVYAYLLVGSVAITRNLRTVTGICLSTHYVGGFRVWTKKLATSLENLGQSSPAERHREATPSLSLCFLHVSLSISLSVFPLFLFPVFSISLSLLSLCFFLVSISLSLSFCLFLVSLSLFVSPLFLFLSRSLSPLSPFFLSRSLSSLSLCFSSAALSLSSRSLALSLSLSLCLSLSFPSYSLSLSLVISTLSPKRLCIAKPSSAEQILSIVKSSRQKGERRSCCPSNGNIHDYATAAWVAGGGQKQVGEEQWRRGWRMGAMGLRERERGREWGRIFMRVQETKETGK